MRSLVPLRGVLAAALLVAAAFLSAFLFPLGGNGSSVLYVSLIFAFFAYFFAGMASKGKPLPYLWLSFKGKRLPLLFLLGIATGIACLLASFALSAVLYAAGLLDAEPVLDKLSSLPLPALIAAFTIAPLCEEMFFRGFLLRMLSESVFPKLGSLAFASSAALSSFIFAIMHFSYGSLAEIAVAFSIGLILCASIRKWGSLVPAIVAHALFNFASVAAMVLS